MNINGFTVAEFLCILSISSTVACSSCATFVQTSTIPCFVIKKLKEITSKVHPEKLTKILKGFRQGGGGFGVGGC